jgi:Peptidase family S41/PDZ domain
VRRLLFVVLLVLCVAPGCFAQLTHEQKISDFKALVGLYNKNYGPYEWKKDVFNFDLLQIQPWLDQVANSTSDLAFYDICVRYVASLHDSHDEFVLPSEYEAFLPLTADIYDGRVLIDSLDPSLDTSVYTFTVGDEIVSLDGISVNTWINTLTPYTVNGSGNSFSQQRLAVAIMLDRFQGWYTFASNVQPGDNATLLIRNQNTGKTQTFTIPWETVLIPLIAEGPVPNPSRFAFSSKNGPSRPGARFRSIKEQSRMVGNPWHAWAGVPNTPAVRHALGTSPAIPANRRLRQFNAKYPKHVLAGGIEPFGSIIPLFNPPAGFVLRLGAGATDEFLTGTFPVNNKLVGFIRIPSFEPASEANALAQMQEEITYFQQNTDGLVVDIMDNGGGDACYENLLAQFLIPTTFQPLRGELRATEQWVEDFEVTLLDAEIAGAGQDTIDTLTNNLVEVLNALGENRGNTPPTDFISPAVCFQAGGAQYPPATDSNGNNIAYTKPILVLTNNFTLSAAEFFGATLQDAKRVTVYGIRSDGGGGNVVEFNTTPYSEGSARVTLSLGVRNHNISSPGFPTAPFLENIGVVPDIQADFQTRANLLTGGEPFVAGFSSEILKMIKTGHP